MKLVFDLFPVILFFVAYKVTDIYTATAVAIADALELRPIRSRLRLTL
jgi:intracellular septation protein